MAGGNGASIQRRYIIIIIIIIIKMQDLEWHIIMSTCYKFRKNTEAI